MHQTQVETDEIILYLYQLNKKCRLNFSGLIRPSLRLKSKRCKNMTLILMNKTTKKKDLFLN